MTLGHLGHWERFDQLFDEEAGLAELGGDLGEGHAPCRDLPALAPRLGDGLDCVVGTTEAVPVPGRVVGADNEDAVASEDPVDLAKEADPVVDLVVDESVDGDVDALVFDPGERVFQRVDPEIGFLADSCSGQFDHPGRGVASRHLGSPLDQFCDIDARSTSGVQHPLALDVTDQLEHGRPVIESVARRGSGVISILRSDRVVLGRIGIAHRQILRV